MPSNNDHAVWTINVDTELTPSNFELKLKRHCFQITMMLMILTRSSFTMMMLMMTMMTFWTTYNVKMKAEVSCFLIIIVNPRTTPYLVF